MFERLAALPGGDGGVGSLWAEDATPEAGRVSDGVKLLTGLVFWKHIGIQWR